MSFWRNVLSAWAIGSCVLASQAGAVIVGGGVASGTGSFEILSTAVPFTVGEDNFDTDNLYGFNEDQNIVVPRRIAVTGGVSPKRGEVVASHYVFFDPLKDTRIRGYILFDAKIYGIASSRRKMDASDFLANTKVTYLSPDLRGLEKSDRVWIDPRNPFRLNLSLRASSPGDYVRVFTMESPIAAQVPLPGALPLLLSAVAATLVMSGRRRRRC